MAASTLTMTSSEGMLPSFSLVTSMAMALFLSLSYINESCTHHKPKKWKEYFLEYLMIVLAVKTGFFAESLREHLSDKSKEHEYLTSLAAELKYDTAQYRSVLQK